MRICVFDLSNILYRSFYANRSDSDEMLIAGLAHAAGLTAMNRWFNQFKPDKIYACFDRPSWRKQYTKSDECISKRPYKGNRRQSMTPAEKKRYDQFIQHIGEFEEILKNHTAISVLSYEHLEADDLMAGVVHHCSHKQQTNDLVEYDDSLLNEIIIVSSDKDLIQMLRHPNVRLVDPATGLDRTLTEWDDDADWFMFEKCFRGDRGDNVMSALPRVLKTRLKKAYIDDFEKINLLNETWIYHATNQEFKVGEIFKENQLLMDLTCQPPNIKESIHKCILDENVREKKFDYFKFSKFLGKYKLKKVSEQLQNYVPMLSGIK